MRMLSANTIALVAVMILSSKLISGNVGELAYDETILFVLKVWRYQKISPSDSD